MKKSVKNAERLVRLQKALFVNDIIKDHKVENLVNRCGYVVSLRLAYGIDFKDSTLWGWKELFSADSFYIKIKRNALWVRYYVYYDSET